MRGMGQEGGRMPRQEGKEQNTRGGTETRMNKTGESNREGRCRTGQRHSTDPANSRERRANRQGSRIERKRR